MQGSVTGTAGSRAIVTTQPIRPSTRAVRRHARRHGQLSVGDHVAFWRAQSLARQCAREVDEFVWSVPLRVALVLVFLVAGLAAGALFG